MLWLVVTADQFVLLIHHDAILLTSNPTPRLMARKEQAISNNHQWGATTKGAPRGEMKLNKCYEYRILIDLMPTSITCCSLIFLWDWHSRGKWTCQVLKIHTAETRVRPPSLIFNMWLVLGWPVAWTDVELGRRLEVPARVHDDRE